MTVQKSQQQHSRKPTPTEIPAHAQTFIFNPGDWDPNSWDPQNPDLPNSPANFLPFIWDTFLRFRNTPVLRQLLIAMLDWWDARDQAWHDANPTLANLGNDLAVELARYELMARNYRNAHWAWTRAVDYPPMRPIWAQLRPRALRTTASPPTFLNDDTEEVGALHGHPAVRFNPRGYLRSVMEQYSQPAPCCSSPARRAPTSLAWPPL